MNEKTRPPKKRRSFFRMSLRAFLLFATVVMVLGGYFLPRIQRQRMAVQTIEKNGGTVFYDYQYVDRYVANATSTVPPWVLNRLGPDTFHCVTAVGMNARKKDSAWTYSANIPDESWAALAELTDVRRLEIHAVTDADSFRNVTRLKKLESIEISTASLTDESIAYLDGLSELRFVWITDAGLDDASLEVFARLPKLRTLRLQDGAFSNKGLAAISAAPQLTELFLSGERCTIDDDGLAELAKLTRLKILGLQNTQTTDTGLQHFAPMKSIKELQIGYTNVTWAGADQFKKTKRPDVIFQGGGLTR